MGSCIKFYWPLIAVCLVVSNFCHAAVMRHDIAAKNYAVENGPEYMVDMPHEGHGVLIAPQWIVTVAHVIF